MAKPVGGRSRVNERQRDPGFRDEQEWRPHFDYESARSEPVENRRQQDKITAILISGNATILNAFETRVTEGERDRVLKDFAEEKGYGKIEDLKWLLSKIGSYEYPLGKKPWLVGEEIKDAPYPMNGQIWEMVTTMNEPSYGRTRRVEIKNAKSIRFTSPEVVADNIRIFKQRYEDPIDFDRFAQVFLNQVSMNSPRNSWQYEESKRVLGKILYGKKWEYYQQIKLMTKEGVDRINAEQRKHQTHERGSYQRQTWDYEASRGDEQRRPTFKLTRKYRKQIENGHGEVSSKQWRDNYSEKIRPWVEEREEEIRVDGGVPLSLTTEDDVFMFSIPPREPTQEEAEELLHALVGEIKRLCPEDSERKRGRFLRQIISPDVTGADLPDLDDKIRNELTKVLNADPEAFINV